MKNLLIIDDEPHLIGVLEFMLKGIADRIYSASSGPEGLLVIQQNEIHCVLCDMNLPRMNGIEILKDVRSRGIAVPFIFFTAEENPDVLMEAARNGALDFLFKPHLRGLQPAVNAGLESRPHQPSPESSYGKILSRLSFERDGKQPNS